MNRIGIIRKINKSLEEIKLPVQVFKKYRKDENITQINQSDKII